MPRSPAARGLLVADQRLVAYHLRRRLHRSGYPVVGVAATGAHAMQLAERLRPKVILMDVCLRGALDGIEAAHAIRAWASIPIVYRTASTDAVTTARIRASSAAAMRHKPVVASGLHHTRQAVLQRAPAVPS